MLRHAVTSTFDPLTLKFRNVSLLTLYQILAKSNYLRRSYCDFNMSNLGAIDKCFFYTVYIENLP